MSEKEDVLNKAYDLLLYLVPQLEKFPRSQKFLLGDRIETRVLEILEMLIHAYYSPQPQKLPILRRVNLALEQLRYLVRLSHDLHHLNRQKYGFVAEQVNTIGRMVGGWIKALA